MSVDYWPYEERFADHQYHDMLREILEHGRRVVPIHSKIQKTEAENDNAVAFKITGGEITYEMANGFPLLTERDLSIYWNGIVGELVGFLNGAMSHQELSKYGCKFWKRWTRKEKVAQFGQKEGGLGQGSYGHSWANWPKAGGSVSEAAGILFWRFLGENLRLPVRANRYKVNQIESITAQIKEKPYLRTHVLMVMNPEFYMASSLDNRRTVVAPCHGEVLLQVYPNEKELEVVHRQRSGDFPVGVQFNIAQYALLGMMFAHLLGYKLTRVIHQYTDRHIYLGQKDPVNTMLSREPRRFPTVRIKEGVQVNRIADFRAEHFAIEDYLPHPAIERIWTPE